MVSEQTINKAVERIVALADPVKVILFGSYARGDANEDADLDIMVIERSVRDRGEEMVRLRGAIGAIGVGVDLLVYSEEEYERRSQVPGTALYWARKEGRALYEAAH